MLRPSAYLASQAKLPDPIGYASGKLPYNRLSGKIKPKCLNNRVSVSSVKFPKLSFFFTPALGLEFPTSDCVQAFYAPDLPPDNARRGNLLHVLR